MYSVSEDYKKAIRQRVVNDRIAGSIALSDGTNLMISDRNLVKNSLKISHELCDDYRIGTFHIGCLQIAVFDDNALLRDFSGARIEPVYEIETEKGWERVPMGIYYTDGNSVRRKRNTVSLTAYDCGCFFDRMIPEEKKTLSGNARILVAAACADCGVTFGGIPETLPNYNVGLSAADTQIQTYRDMIAWCAELLCAYAVIDRAGKLWFRSAKYSVSPTDNTDIIIDKYLTEVERDSITVTDTRAYIRSICAYSAGVLKTYVSDTVQTDEQAAPAGYTFAENPLLPKMLTREQQEKINTDRLMFIDGFKQRGINAEIYGDPALDAGDVLRCSGGDIDQRRSIVGLVTKQEWRYRNFHTIVCAAPPLLGRDAATAAVVASQTDKKLDALSGKCKYTAGTGIEISGNEIKLKTAGKGVSIFDVDQALGGVYIGYKQGLELDYDGRLSLSVASGGYIGGITIGDGLIDSSVNGRCSINIGKGMRFNSYNDYDPGANVYYGKSVSPNLGDGLKLDPSEDEEDPDYGKLHLNLGKGLEFGERKYEKKKDSEGNDTEDDDPTRYTSEVQIKLGEGLKFGENGELIVEGGTELAAGGGITIETDGETGKQTISAAVGEGAEIRDGKICTVPNIQNAVFISEKDAKYLLHNFTEIEYIAGNRIGYAGPGNQIVVQGYLAYFNTTLGGSINGSVYQYTDEQFEASLADKSRYFGMSAFKFYSNYYSAHYTGLRFEIQEATVTKTTYITFGIKETGEDQNIGGLINYSNWSGTGLLLSWDTIYPPGYTDTSAGSFEFGGIKGNLHTITKGSGTNPLQAYLRTPFYRETLYVPFASLAEYQAAVGLTYELLTLTRVEDSPTVVSGSEVN